MITDSYLKKELMEGGAKLCDLSLHILDMIEISIRAKASVILVTIAEKVDEDTLEIIVEDNGRVIRVPPEKAPDPFYTTKHNGKTGLGLSLFRAAAERAGGTFTLGKSILGGGIVKARMQLSHADRSPLGDIAKTISSVVCTNPDIDLTCRICLDNKEYVVRAADVVKELPIGERFGLAVARLICNRIKKDMERLKTSKKTLVEKQEGHNGK